MKQVTPLHLSEDERTHMEVFVRRGKANARTLTRARVLLKCDEGWSNGEIVEAFEVSDQTIRNVRQRYGAGGVEAVLTDKRQAQRRQALSDAQAAHLIAITCSEVPMGMTTGRCACWLVRRWSWDMCDASRQKPCASY